MRHVRILLAAHTALAVLIGSLLTLLVSSVVGAADYTLDQLPTARNARAQVVQQLTGVKLRTTEVMAAAQALETKWSLAAIAENSFGLFEGPEGDNMVSIALASTTVKSINAKFLAGDVGKTIDIAGAGPAATVLRAKISAFVGAGEVVIDTAAGSAVVPTKTSAAGHAIWGWFPGMSFTTTPLLVNGGATQLVYPSFNLSGMGFSGVIPIANGGTALTTENVINVKNYGAAGDGVADDTAEIRAAYAAAKAASKTLYLPAGTYLMNGDASYDEVTFGNLYVSTTNIAIVGDGPGSTIIKNGSAVNSGLRYVGSTGGSIRGITIDQNGSSGFGLCVAGQYMDFTDITVKNITGTRLLDTDIGKIGVVIPGATVCSFKNITLQNCANGVYSGFGAPTQYIRFEALNSDPSTDAFTVRGRTTTALTLNNSYVEGAPFAIMDIVGCNGFSLTNTTAEIVGDAPLTTTGHFIITNCVGVNVDSFFCLYSTGAPAGKNIFEMATNTATTMRGIAINLREDIADVIAMTAVTDQLAIDGIYVNAVVAGKVAVNSISGASNTATVRNVTPWPIRLQGSYLNVSGAGCDVYMLTGAARNLHADVLSGNKIYLDASEMVGSLRCDYIPAANNNLFTGGGLQVETIQANSYFIMNNTTTTIRAGNAATPEGAVTAGVGSLYLGNAGGAGTIWIKTSGVGNTGWVQITVP